MPRRRGGARQGTPGVAYTNRTDLMLDRAPGNTIASGGMVAPTPPQQPSQPQQEQGFGIHPEDTPNLMDPSQRPGEPVTAGIGQGPANMMQLSAQEASMFRPWLPMLMKYADSGLATPTFVLFTRRLRDTR